MVGEKRMADRRKERRRRVERARELSPLLSAEEAAAYCRVSYSWLMKELSRYARQLARGERRVPPARGIDIVAAGPEKIGRSWVFLREDLDRVLGISSR